MFITDVKELAVSVGTVLVYMLLNIYFTFGLIDAYSQSVVAGYALITITSSEGCSHSESYGI